MPRPPRLAARALILQQDRLLVVNAYPPGGTELWCAPGGGVEPHSSLPENLAREVFEETGLRVKAGAPCLINEFHDPERGFHQVELYFRCEILEGALDEAWWIRKPLSPAAALSAARNCRAYRTSLPVSPPWPGVERGSLTIPSSF